MHSMFRLIVKEQAEPVESIETNATKAEEHVSRGARFLRQVGVLFALLNWNTFLEFRIFILFPFHSHFYIFINRPLNIKLPGCQLHSLLLEQLLVFGTFLLDT